MDPSLITTALLGAETAIERALRYDPASRQALARLSGKVLALHFTQPELTLYLLPHADGLELASHWEGEVDTRLTGKLGAFIAMARGEQTTLAGSGVQLEGSTALVQELQRIARQLDIDWEEALSERLGDVTGHQSAESLRRGASWLKARESQARRLLSEFVTEEARLLPSRPELEHFYRSVDDLQLQLERAEARLNHLLHREDSE